MTIKTRPVPNYGDMMTLEEFIDLCKCDALIDYDGHGYYAESQEIITDVLCIPSDILNGDIKNEYQYMIWFNK